MRAPIIAANWKMHTTIAEAVHLVDAMLNDLEAIRGVEIVLCPPFLSLYPVYEQLRGGPLRLGAQDNSEHEQGAYTGDIAASMLAPICHYVILGHSERRHYHGETDAVINRKLRLALGAKMAPILCVGETLEQNLAGETEAVIERQLRGAFDGIADPRATVIAYEPIWAIGTGHAATDESANRAAAFIRSIVRQLYGDICADDLRIQYGGSVTAANAHEFISQPDIDGALVGGASLKPTEFVAICRAAAKVKAPEELLRSILGA